MVRVDKVAGLPADVRDDVEADERGERERDGDGDRVDVEGKLAGITRVHEVLLHWMDYWRARVPRAGNRSG